MTLDESVAGFVKHIECERRASPRTVEAYADDLEGLKAFVRERGVAATGDVRKIDVYLLRGWLG
ncbi:MAG: site-specific integrase, partial [Polyangiaceae bacterium]